MPIRAKVFLPGEKKPIAEWDTHEDGRHVPVESKDEPTKKRIQAAWEDYRARVMPEHLSLTQQIETRRGFYAGALSMFMIVINQATPGDEVTAEDLQMMDELQKELDQFLADLKAGVA